MILILSTPSDITTNNVIDFLHDKKIEYLRVNDHDIIYGKIVVYIDYTNPTNSFFSIKNKKTSFSKVTKIWLRKFGLFSIIKEDLLQNINYDSLLFLKNEFYSFREILFKQLIHKKWLCHPDGFSKTKYEMIISANNWGIKTPNTYIISSINELNKIPYKVKISKPIHEVTHINMSTLKKEEYYLPLFPQLLTSIPRNKKQFFPSLVQNYIEKEYEIRTFYLDKKFFSMAIFSQQNEKTKIDFRNIDLTNPNRNIPYQLPKDLQLKIIHLMKDLNLNIGVLDLIKSTNNEYYFLEVNPVGQFGLISRRCNYNIEETISNYLIEL